MFGEISARSFGLSRYLISIISDSWNRTTSGGLGTSSIGNVWLNLRGTWTANNTGLATTATTASSYPLATVPFKVASTMTAQSVSAGAGIAFWVTDSNNFWGVINSAYTYTTSTAYYYSCCSAYGAICTAYGRRRLPYGRFANVCVSYGYGCTAYTTCTGYTPTTTYYWGLSLIRSVANTISKITTVSMTSSSSSTPNLIQSIQVVTTPSGGITATAFSDTALMTTVNTLTSTQTPPTGNVSTGIILVPTGSPYTGIAASSDSHDGGVVAPPQGNSIGTFNAI